MHGVTLDVRKGSPAVLVGQRRNEGGQILPLFGAGVPVGSAAMSPDAAAGFSCVAGVRVRLRERLGVTGRAA